MSQIFYFGTDTYWYKCFWLPAQVHFIYMDEINNNDNTIIMNILIFNI